MDKIRGVNLGGWFVLERWMKPALFEGVSGPDETVFCIETENAKEKLKEHWKTFITEEDFAYIKGLGINSVRLPIPWWTFVEAHPYFNSVPYIKLAMEWASRYDLKVLLDLHTAPGCQNGFDNGGVTGVIDWPKKQENIDLTVEILGKIAEQFSTFDSLWGIQVLNEPHWTIDMELLQTFYRRAYSRIREVNSDVVIVFHDGFRPTDESWKDFFTKNRLEKVVFDLHLYQCFDPKFNDYKITDHIEEAIKRGKELIQPINTFVPVIVGEWSLGLHGKVFEGFDPFNSDNALRLYAGVQLQAYDQGLGWYFWSYKLDIKGQSGWNFRQLVERSILPSSYGL